MLDPPNSTEMRFIAGADDLTGIGYVADTAYLQWVQAIVVNHWERFAPKPALAATLWMAVKHKTVYHSAAFDGDHIVARTAIKGLRGVRAVFLTVFVREEILLAQIESTWVCIDRGTRKPKMLGNEVIEAFGLNRTSSANASDHRP